MNTKELKDAIRATMREFGYKTNKVAVELDGKVCYLTETEVRALQVMVMRNPELRESIKIYNGRTKRGSDVINIYKNGYLDAPFHSGFFDTNTKLSRALMF
jgi:hypothetical protein